jgi:hypothetical protein
MKKSNQGQIMLLTVLILGGVIISAASLLGFLVIYKIRQITDLGNSAKAVFAADAGIEWELLRALKPGQRYRSCPNFSNGAGFQSNVKILEEQALEVRSIGQASGIVRIHSQISNVNAFTSTSTYPTSQECF